MMQAHVSSTEKCGNIIIRQNNNIGYKQVKYQYLFTTDVILYLTIVQFTPFINYVEVHARLYPAFTQKCAFFHRNLCQVIYYDPFMIQINTRKFYFAQYQKKGNMALFLSENYFYLQFSEAVNYISIQKYHEFLKVIGYSCII